ncbi:CBY1-interacting BAR domain-containing protein 1-B [Anabrus simplex]|uniref:CBY1-interacting BAR domain-containing protein 1-B n=1 Tax=Anabrus simplex TaxID=316456 RepID=UPI0035A333F0
MQSARPQNMTSDQQAKFILERISSVEKHFAEMCTAFGAYARKNAGLRDKTDEVAKVVNDYAEAENVNKSLKTGLLQFSGTLCNIGDYRDVHVQRLENKVVSELSQYEGICKHAKDEVKSIFAVRDREISRRRHLDRLRERNPRNRQQISMAESELMKASADVSRTVKALEEQVDMFEKKKLHDIRAALLGYVTIELSFHAKAVELFTKAYQELADIDEDQDLEDFQQIRGDFDWEFRNALRVPESVSRLDTVKRTSFRSSAFSLANLFSTPPSFRHSEPQPGPSRSPTLSEVKNSSRSRLEGSSESMHVKDFVEEDNDSSSVVSEEEEEEEEEDEAAEEIVHNRLTQVTKVTKMLYADDDAASPSDGQHSRSRLTSQISRPILLSCKL